ncbi:MAG: hypothetical protein DYG89_25730 [Caldilinea sp. CFX5]|nr:hypothetical protein [Caldilinea sp. CFX5]
MTNQFPLRFLADECCDFAVVRALRAAGYDVLAISEMMQRSDDRKLIEFAVSEQRIFLTEDKDFGWLVYVSHVDSAGVIFIRYPNNARTGLGSTIVQLVQEQGTKLRGSFVVVQPGQIRLNRQRPADRT